MCGRGGGQIVVTLTSLRFPGKEVRPGGGNAERTSETHALTSATVVARACVRVRADCQKQKPKWEKQQVEQFKSWLLCQMVPREGSKRIRVQN